MNGGPRLFDPGLQPERTALAWRRTALSLAVASVASARLLFPVGATFALLAAVIGLLSSLVLAHRASRRYRSANAALARSTDTAGTNDTPGAMPDGRLIALCALTTLGAGVSVAVFLFT
jgi:hypothetical protein